MRKVIDLCLDMPDFAEDLVRTACHFCLPEHKTAWAGYRQSFNGGIEKKLGMTFAELDALLENEGREPILRFFVGYLCFSQLNYTVKNDCKRLFSEFLQSSFLDCFLQHLYLIAVNHLFP